MSATNAYFRIGAVTIAAAGFISLVGSSRGIDICATVLAGGGPLSVQPGKRPIYHGDFRYVVGWVPRPGSILITVPVSAGSFVTHFAKQVHFDGTKAEDAVLEIVGMGPGTATPLADTKTSRTTKMYQSSGLKEIDE
jgi:hypothetical protein